MFDRIAVAGLGILGGSLCRSIRAAFPGTEIFGYDLDQASMSKAVDENVLDGMFRPGDDLTCYDCIAVALPVRSSIDFLTAVLDKSADGCIIIDTGSVKAPVIDALRNRPGFARFVPCHPMAGSDRSGYANSTEDLFRGATVIVTPHEKNSPDDVAKASSLWTDLGSRVVYSDAAVHDRIVARTSHLPHLLSSALSIVAAAEGRKCRPFCGKGIADMTRLSGGSPSVWTDVALMNADNILEAIDEYSTLIEELKTVLQSDGAMRQFLEKGVCAKKELFDEEDNRRS